MTESTTLVFDENFFCSELAQRCDEPIHGSAAAATTVWLALEVPQPWGAKALPESDLPAPVKAQLDGWQQTIPGVRLQFIKSDAGFVGEGIQFFVALASDDAPLLYRFQLERYEDLLTLDLPAVVARHPRYAEHQHREPLFLVCTNGKRDRCCAKWGLPVYRAMADYAGVQVWQTTHTGGHRFAATMVCLPEGVCYGWLTPEDAAPLIEAHRQRLIYRLDRYRGRSTYPPVSQAAEALLREQSGILDLSAFHFVEQVATGEEEWQVSFAGTNGQVHSITVAAQPVELGNPHSCGKEEGETVYRYRVLQ